jgi:hypothetical protein
MAKTDITDHPDAVRRILDANADYGAGSPAAPTTEREIVDALRERGGPQVTPEVAANLAEGVTTEQDIIDAIDAQGELPREAEIGDIAAVLDDYTVPGMSDDVAAAVSDRVVTQDMVDVAVMAAETDSDGPLYRDDVERAIDSAADGKQFVGASRGETATRAAREVGAPSREAVQDAAFEAVQERSESTTPAEMDSVDSDGTTPITVIRDTSGEPAAVLGGASAEATEQIAAETGAQVYKSPDSFMEDVEPDGTGRRVDLRAGKSKIGEVEIE